MSFFNFLVSGLKNPDCPPMSFGEAEDNIKNIFSIYDQLGPSENKVYDVISYEDVITWFLSQPKHPCVKFGAIGRKSFDKKSIAIIQVFLDDRYNLIPRHQCQVYGRKVLTNSLDIELCEEFGSRNVILVH
jgi:hypothetical protein